MNFNLEEHLPEGFPENSRVWIYQANRLFLMQEAFDIDPLLNNFVAEWNSHGDKVHAYANLFFGRFLVFIADETAVKVSGCSTDSSVRFVKEIGDAYKVNFFDRQLLAFYIKDKVEMIPMSQLDYAIKNGFVKEDTLYFNNTVQTLAELRNWITPAGNTWMRRYFEKVA